MQKGTAALFVLIAILVGGILVGLVLFGKSLAVNGTSSLNSSLDEENAIPKQLESPEVKENTFSSQKLGFQFSYPKRGYTAKEDTEEQYNQRGNGNYRKNFKGYVGYEPGEFFGAVVVLDGTNSYNNNPFSLWVFNNQDNISVEKWFDLYWYYPFLWGVFDYTSKGHVAPDSEATISGEPAVAKIVSYQQGSPKYIYISKNQKMYLFRVIGETGDKILSGFQFKQ